MNPRPRLLLVDDEARILRSLAMLFRGSYEVRTSTDAREALAMLEAEPAHVVVSDQRMPVMTGAAFLREVRQRAPQTMRILLTGYSELDAVVASVNEGEIFRFVNKPWDARELRQTVDEAARVSAALIAAGQKAPPQPLFTETGGFVVAPASAPEAVLVIDDDADVTRVVQEILGPSVPVFCASSIDAALPLIAAQPIAVVVSELAVGGDNVTGLLKWLKAEHPEIVSIVLTPFQDVSVFIGLINQGQVYRLLPKPVRAGPLGMSLASALRHHRALRDAPALVAAHSVEKIQDSVELSVANRVMGALSRLRLGRRPVNG